jgi:hypothetical protein
MTTTQIAESLRAAFPQYTIDEADLPATIAKLGKELAEFARVNTQLSQIVAIVFGGLARIDAELRAGLPPEAIPAETDGPKPGAMLDALAQMPLPAPDTDTDGD